ncbi:hypothetical protein TNIN_266321 [Trichonephila inaurata madagascariensis]|uniref:Uncharacterized protein n=1 Tax=Trichonephila inaurata madagascariensis TaxID=2747483 RepID=A0A8X6JHU1_9ARAC|nr:hypothetical protein TNIN_266321 [Trichonephila inaurata madagascariensis]
MAECPQRPPSDASFEDQLFWCLKHLEEKLQAERVSPREAQSILRSIKLLRSKRTPFVQKRQVMRLACGDYRKKMEEEVETTKQQIIDSKIEPVHDSSVGRALRKAKSVKTGEKKKPPLNTFQFNFADPEEGNGVFE